MGTQEPILTYGYCRVSTPRQSIERQVRNVLQAFPHAIIIQETYTGTTTQRPRWDRLKRQLLREAGSGERVRVVFDSVSRMSRNASEGFALYEELYDAGIELVFLKEPHINSAVYRQSLETVLPTTGTAVDLILDGVRAYMMQLAREQIRLAFAQAEKEVQDLHRRTAEGIETARLAGKQIGRAPGTRVVTQKQKRAVELIRRHSRDFDGALTDAEVMKLAGVSRNSFYKYKKIASQT